MGDGNLHLSAAQPGPFTPEMKTVISEAVEHGVKAFGGAISAEHGIGEDKMAALSRALTPAALGTMKAVKQALDPAGILNRGKIFG
jgi:FAD/FMN-containing dehydrogenase